MIVYISDPKNSTGEFLKLINTFSKVSGYKIKTKKSLALHYTNDKWIEKEISLKYIGLSFLFLWFWVLFFFFVFVFCLFVCFLVFFETGFLCVVLAVLELIL